MTARYSTGARNALNDSGLAAFDGGSARINTPSLNTRLGVLMRYSEAESIQI